MAACSVMYRVETLRTLPAWHNTIVNQDLTWQVCSAQHGLVGYLPNFMGVYRLHRAGLSKRMTALEHAMAAVEYARLMASYFHGTEHWEITQNLLADGLSRVAVEHWQAGDLDGFERYAAESLRVGSLGGMSRLRCHAPSVYIGLRTFRNWLRGS